MTQVSKIEAFDSTIYLLEKKMNETQDFYKRKEYKEKLFQAKRDREIELNIIQQESQEKEKIEEYAEKVVIETSNRDLEIKERINSYL